MSRRESFDLKNVLYPLLVEYVSFDAYRKSIHKKYALHLRTLIIFVIFFKLEDAQ